MDILKFQKKSIFRSYLAISVLGISYKLNIKYSTVNSINLNKRDKDFELILPKQYKNSDNIDIINHAIMKLYSELAPSELEYSLELVRHIVKFAPDDYKIERLKNNFYKTTKDKILVINPDIIQYSKEIINVTLIQAFCKMQFNKNSNAYKNAIKNAMKCYEEYKNEIDINANAFTMVG